VPQPWSDFRLTALDALVLMVAKVAVGAWVLRQGFTHVSDDDYARTVIAEQFVHAPRLDPSATSWLPLPFWLEGTAMMAGGRTLEVARAVAVVLGAASVAAPYLAMRAVGVRRAAALVATAVAMVLPWNAWLGVATVPEAWFGAIVAAAAITLDREDARPWAAGALLAAALSRYEAWPVCALIAVLALWRAARGSPAGSLGSTSGPEHARPRWRRDVASALLAAAGPAAWMAWNAHAHGSALHFITRVTTFRHSIGAADAPLSEKLLAYPRALMNDTPEAAVLGLVGLAGLAHPPLRARWRWAAAAALSVFVFLVWGDVRDGAPTHHPARALAATWWILVGMGVDALATLGERMVVRRRALALGVAGAAGIAWCASLPGRWADAPGESDAERREGPLARGLDLRARAVPHVEVTPCAFEHFALLAAWGAPERASVAPRTGAPLTAACPLVIER
jgi:hypothetical protein